MNIKALDKLKHGISDISRADRTSAFLGYFSLALGAAEVFAPRWVAKQAGLPADSAPALRLCGIREIMQGAGILNPVTRKAGLWSRVVGDVIDLAVVGGYYSKPGANQSRIKIATGALVGIAALDTFAALSSNGTSAMQPVQIRESVTINKNPEELFSYWRNLENLPYVMSFVESVKQLDGRRSRWTVGVPAGRTLEWTSEIIAEKPNEFLSWRTVDGSDIEHSGSVRFTRMPGQRWTDVAIDMRFDTARGVTGGVFGKLLAQLTGPKIRQDLRRFKELMERDERSFGRDEPMVRPQTESPFNVPLR